MCWCTDACKPPSGIHIRVSLRVHQYIYISPCVWVCVSAKCHIDRLIAVVSDSVTLWLVDSSLIHTPSWVIGPAHWFPACQPSQEELGGRKRACRYWLAPDQPHHHLHIPCTPNQCSCNPTACSLTMPSDRVSLCLWFFHLSTLFCSLFHCATGCFVSCCGIISINQFFFILFCEDWNIFLLIDFTSCRSHLTPLYLLCVCQYFHILSSVSVHSSDTSPKIFHISKTWKVTVKLLSGYIFTEKMVVVHLKPWMLQ